MRALCRQCSALLHLHTKQAILSQGRTKQPQPLTQLLTGM
jgi:hypothetical protein